MPPVSLERSQKLLCCKKEVAFRESQMSEQYNVRCSIVASINYERMKVRENAVKNQKHDRLLLRRETKQNARLRILVSLLGRFGHTFQHYPFTFIHIRFPAHILALSFPFWLYSPILGGFCFPFRPLLSHVHTAIVQSVLFDFGLRTG